MVWYLVTREVVGSLRERHDILYSVVGDYAALTSLGIASEWVRCNLGVCGTAKDSLSTDLIYVNSAGPDVLTAVMCSTIPLC